VKLKKPQLDELRDLHRLLASGQVTRFGIAIDGGAHIGGWTVALAQRFGRVIAFEPCPETAKALRINTADLPNVEVRAEALMDRSGTVQTYAPGKTETLTARRVAFAETGDAVAVTIDSLELDGLDFLKLDVEGTEWLALKGARATIRRHRPFVVIEEAGIERHMGIAQGAAAGLLRAWGYAKVWGAGVNSGWAP